MSLKSIGLSDELHAYVVAHGPAADPVVEDLIAETRSRLTDVAELQIAPEQAPFMTLMTRIVGARHAVEVGTFTGLSALSIARGLAPDGRLICFDVSKEWTDVARRYWERAGVSDRVELRLGPAAERLPELPPERHIDIAFIDADKTNYPTYWAELVPRMRPGGVILVDNVLRHGRIVAPETADDRAMVKFNAMVTADERVDAVITPIADGITIARVR
jgi:predicted O-methyltransferase YrrM